MPTAADHLHSLSPDRTPSPDQSLSPAALPPAALPPAALPPAALPPAASAAILERISDGFLALDADWRITYLNERAAQVLGRRREDLVGTLVWEEFPEEMRAEFHEACREAVRTQKPLQFDAFSSADGRWFGCRVYPAPDGLSLFFQDVTERRETRRRLEENEQRYRSLFEQNVDAVFTFDLEGLFVDANPACEAVSGYSPEELRGAAFLPLVVPEDRERTQALAEQAMRGAAQHEDIAILHKSGRRVEINITKIPIVVDGKVVGIYGIAKDITARKRDEVALRESETWLRAVAEAGPVPMTITRWSDGKIFYANRHVRDLFRVPLGQEVVGRSTEGFFVSPADREGLIGALTEYGHVQNWESQARRADGTTFWASGAFQRMVYHGEDAVFSVYHDVSAQKRLLDEARAEAEQDPLTGLLNHRAFHKRLEEEAERAHLGSTPLAIALVDLDNFKFFNDTYGHAVGDDVLRQVAAVLRASCRAEDVLARFGGDEFALLMPGVGPDTTADGVRAQLAACLGDVRYQPPGLGGAIPIGLSVGVAMFPSEAPTRLAVMQIADERLLRAKSGAGADAEALRVRGVLRDSVQGFSMLDALVTAVDAKDRYTRRHSEDVMAYCLQIAQRLGLSEEDRHTLAVAALLHDVGKIGVPDQILRKPGRLTPEEFEAIRLHPNIGAAIVAAVPALALTLGAVRHHHERWDGEGYPDGLRAEETPPFARLLAVADAYSAMTTDRPYRKGLAPAEARRRLAEGAGSQWDPVCVEAFLGDA